MTVVPIYLVMLAILALLFGVLLLGTSYFIPTLIAYRRGHQNLGLLFVINLLFGMTLVGWAICIAWALTGKTKDEKGNKYWVPKQNQIFW